MHDMVVMYIKFEDSKSLSACSFILNRIYFSTHNIGLSSCVLLLSQLTEEEKTRVDKVHIYILSDV